MSPTTLTPSLRDPQEPLSKRHGLAERWLLRNASRTRPSWVTLCGCTEMNYAKLVILPLRAQQWYIIERSAGQAALQRFNELLSHSSGPSSSLEPPRKG